MASCLRADAVEVFGAGVAAVEPRSAVRRALDVSDPAIAALRAAGRERLGLVAVGKAARGMVAGALDRLGEERVAGGVVVVDSHAAANERGHESKFEWFVAGHPIPDARSVEAADSVRRFVASAAWDRLVVLLSGGGSALLCAPAAGLTLDDKVETTRLLLRAGADIDQLNVVRRHLSAIKGGRLASLLGGRPALVLALSDVPDDDLSVIASGPLYPDRSSFRDAFEVGRRLGLAGSLPSRVRERLAAGAAGELDANPGPGDPIFGRVEHRLVGSNRTAVEAAAKWARSLGYRVGVEPAPVVGESRMAGAALARLLERSQSVRWAWIGGGETAVTVRGDGSGGRNQELALAFALAAPTGDSRDSNWVFLSVGTDGRDGPTDAAGGLVDAGTLDRCRRAGVDPTRALDRNDSGTALAAAGDRFLTGPTGTNVADLQVLLVDDGGSRFE